GREPGGLRLRSRTAADSNLNQSESSRFDSALTATRAPASQPARLRARFHSSVIFHLLPLSSTHPTMAVSFDDFELDTAESDNKLSTDPNCVLFDDESHINDDDDSSRIKVFLRIRDDIEPVSARYKVEGRRLLVAKPANRA